MIIPLVDHHVPFDDLEPLREGRHVPSALGASPGLIFS